MLGKLLEDTQEMQFDYAFCFFVVFVYETLFAINKSSINY